jgi:hypothetical protein
MDAPTVAASRALGTMRAEAEAEFRTGAGLAAGGRGRAPLIDDIAP